LNLGNLHSLEVFFTSEGLIIVDGIT